MSLPREIQEELLSAYLDGALRGDERTRVEQILASDEEARESLAEMRALQASTRTAMQSDRRVSAGLQERVIAAAAARAEEEGLPAEHHVRRAASRKRTAGRRTPAGIPRSYPLAATALALAAALLLAVTLWGPFSGENGTGQLAEGERGETVRVDGAVASTIGEEDEATSEGTDPDQGEQPQGDLEEPGPAEAIASDPTPASESMTEEPATEAADQRPSPEALADASASRPSLGVREPALDRATGPVSSTPAREPGSVDPGEMLAMQAVMIFEVEQTELGRRNNAVLQGMRDAGIRANMKQPLNEAVVGYLQEAQLVGDSNDGTGSDSTGRPPVSVVYVDASGKQLDRFMVSLFQDTEQIAGIGWDLAIDAPVVQAATQIGRVVATDVQHADDPSTAWQLVAGDQQEGFRAPEAGRPFTAIDRGNAENWNMMSAASPGSDIRSRLIILIR